MANCPKCNAVLKEGARFCHVCGFDMQSIPQQEQTPPAASVNPQPVIQTEINQNIKTMEQNTTPTPQQPVAGSGQSSNLISRVIGIITKPKSEWEIVEKETPNQSSILMGYVVPLAIVAAIAAFIGYGLVGVRISFGFGSFVAKSITWGVTQAITSLIVSIGGVFLTAFIIDSLAPSFKVAKNFGRSMQLVAYAYTPMWIGAIFTIYPNIAMLGSLIGLYGLYLLWVGFDYTMKPAADKKTGYYLASLAVMVGVYLILGFILGMIMLAVYNPYNPTFNF